MLAVAVHGAAGLALGGGRAGGVGWVAARAFSGKAKEINPLLWVVTAGFLIYFARGPVEMLLS